MAVFPFPGEDVALAGVDRALWAELLAALADLCGEGDWHKYSKNAAWSWRAKRGERTIVYLLPGADGVTASFALGASALDRVRAAGLGELLEGARKYAEGTAVRVTVREIADVATVLTVARAKIAG